eukprot:jgi/Mesen1/1021/ME000121S00097
MAPRKAAPVVKKEVATLPPIVETEDSSKMVEPWQQVSAAKTTSDRVAAVVEVVAMVKKAGAGAMEKYKVDERIRHSAADSVNAGAREGAMLIYKQLLESISRPSEPYLIPLLPVVLERLSDKTTEVRTAAEAASQALCTLICPFGVKQLLPYIYGGMQDRKNWKTACGSLSLFGNLANTAPRQLALCLPDIIPRVSELMGDSKDEVRKAAYEAMTDVCGAIGNRDIEQFVPALVSCIATPSEVPECVHKLSATTFVQQVNSPTLSIMVPLLQRGLKERQPAIKRKAAVIIDNMSKLIDDPADAAPFLPKLLPGLELVANEAADPEIRKVAGGAHKTLLWVAKEAEILTQNVMKEEEQFKVVLAALDRIVKTKSTIEFGAPAEKAFAYISTMANELWSHKNFDQEDWNKIVISSLTPFISDEDADLVAKEFMDACSVDYEARKVKIVDEDDEEEDLCNSEFSLAYGGKILLNNATLWLKRGRRYGLCGPNGCGKSTLMRAIANGQLEGFPSPDELKTVYVEHDLDSSLAEVSVVDLVANEPSIVDTDREQVEKVLASVGFTDEMRASPVGALSGGWKMKLALARAMLMKADILLLDEPTNHLDVKNVAWLVNYLTTLKGVSSMIVSHDSGFLDNVCTDIIHYENRKLKSYKGNLSEFVKQKPEARVYYELSEAAFAFKFPEPGFLEGVKTKDKAIMKMQHVNFTYEGAEKQTLFDITVQTSLSSRVAIIGPNGAGKSTLVKLLTGEIEAADGLVWKHPNLRVAYVAQHAFHHVEQHLEKTPNEYIRWRYAFGEDREEQDKVSRKVKEEEEKKMAEKIVVDGTKKQVDKLLGRRKLKKSYEYEVQWVNCGLDETSWLSRDRLEDMGFVKLVNEVDAKEAAAQGLYTRPLTTLAVQKHLEDFGLEAEFGTHSHIRGLSGGQKVKVVLGAAMWNNPHLLVLDEPTNYLDRDSLGALATAIRAYGGGVVMISHNSEFTSALCPETWKVDAGRMTLEGEPAWMNGIREKIDLKFEDTMIDALGNTVKIKAPKKKLSRKEMKVKEKERKARRDRGEVVSEDEDDY